MGVKTIEGIFDGKDLKFAIIATRFNDFIVKSLLSGATDALIRHNVKSDDIEVYKVPGAFEIPLLCRKLAGSGRYDAVIALGAVIRGSTPHFDYVASEVAKGVARSAYENDVPVIFGVLTTDSIEQAVERAGAKSGNKGAEAAMSGLETVNLIKQADL